jgi:FkbM family methyltransferase
MNLFFRKNINRLIARLRQWTPEGKFAQMSYGQESEDLLLWRLFQGKKSGFFVDVGAHHPMRFSNTFSLYQAGWRGINIDATPLSMAAFKALRPADINLELGIGEQQNVLTYYRFNEPALNTFSEKIMEQHSENPLFYVVEQHQIEVFPLAQILEKHLPSEIKSIDLLTIDVEGLDLEVLTSNNWDKFRPKIIVVESFITDLEQLQDCPIYCFLKEKNYQIVSKLHNSSIYKDRQNHV